MKIAQLIAALLLSLTLPQIGFAADAKPADGEHKSAARRIDVEEFEKLRADKKNVVVDVRTEKEFKAGHIPGAVNLDVNAQDFDAKVARLDKSKTYMVHCMVGHRSAKACDKFVAAGLTNILDFSVGMKAWQNAGKPIEK